MRGIEGLLLASSLLWILPMPAASEEAALSQLKREFKRPYLSFGALLQVVADAQPERTFPGENGFSVANARVSLSGTLDDGYGYFVQANLTRTPTLLDAHLRWKFRPTTTLTLGAMKTPFSKEFLTSAASIDFVNRSQGVAALAPNRQIGVQVSGKPGSGRVFFGVGLFNGNGVTAGGNDNKGFMGVGRLAVFPPLQDGRALEIGASVMNSEDANFAGNRLALGGDARLTAGRYLFSSEVIYSQLDPDVGVTTSPWGIQATAGRMLSERTQLLARLDHFSTGIGAVDDTSDLVLIGLNVWPNQAIEWQFNYVIDTDAAEIRHHQWLVNAQVAF